MCARETDITTVLQCVRYYDIMTVFRPRPPPLAPPFLSHMMIFPATLDNPTPQKHQYIGEIY